MHINKNTNIFILDSLRAFAAIAVCLYHFVCTTTGFIKNENILSIFSFGKYGVQTFFVISGFVIPWAMFSAHFKLNNFFSFLVKRLARLEPPYLFSVLIAIILLLIRAKFYDTTNVGFNLNYKQIALHFGYLIPFFENYKWLNEVYWTLAVEFQYYFFIGLLFIPLVNTTQFIRILIYTGILLLSFIGKSTLLFYWLPIFLLGILTFLFKANLILKKEYTLVLLITLIFCFYKYQFGLVLFSILPVLCILFCADIKVFILNFLGKFSYSIYLIHTLIGATFINVLSHNCVTSFNKFLVILGGLIISLIAAWLTYLIIEKPSKKLSSSIKYK